MIDPAPPSDEPAPVNLSLEQRVPQAPDLERRVQRLEDEVNALQDTKALEDRVVVRVTERLQKELPADGFTAASPAGRRSRSAVKGMLGRAPRGRYAWLLVDMAADARLLVVMLADRRYALAWTTHLVVWLFIPAILTSGWWFPLAWIPVLGHYLDKVLDLLLAFGVYKALSRESRRYRKMLGHRR